MYKNEPAMNKNDQSDRISTLPITKPTTTPIKHKKLERILNKSAFLSETPFFLKTAKSPISCGNSWKNTAIDVPKPVVMLDANEAPIARPSLKLCRPSPRIIITTELFIFSL